MLGLVTSLYAQRVDGGLVPEVFEGLQTFQLLALPLYCGNSRPQQVFLLLKSKEEAVTGFTPREIAENPDLLLMDMEATILIVLLDEGSITYDAALDGITGSAEAIPGYREDIYLYTVRKAWYEIKEKIEGIS